MEVSRVGDDVDAFDGLDSLGGELLVASVLRGSQTSKDSMDSLAGIMEKRLPRREAHGPCRHCYLLHASSLPTLEKHLLGPCSPAWCALRPYEAGMDH